MTGLLAVMPEYVSDVSVIALALSLVVAALPALITGRLSLGPDWSARRVRASVSLVLAFAIGFALLVVFVLSPTQRGEAGTWGTTGSTVGLAVWLLIVCALTARNVRRELRFLRADSSPRLRR